MNLDYLAPQRERVDYYARCTECEWIGELHSRSKDCEINCEECEALTITEDECVYE